jgi:rare lipoprotein A
VIAARRHATIALASLLLVGCASGRGRVPGEPIPDPIEALQGEADQEIARGPASWYGEKFQGRRTASGERFDMHGFTAAHPSLPFGTRLTVRNPANGREVAVRVNDRGPLNGSRIIDLSRAAAQAIGLLEAGVATVVLLQP